MPQYISDNTMDTPIIFPKKKEKKIINTTESSEKIQVHNNEVKINK